MILLVHKLLLEGAPCSTTMINDAAASIFWLATKIAAATWVPWYSCYVNHNCLLHATTDLAGKTVSLLPPCY